MANTLLFHVEVFMPAAYREPIYMGPLRYGRHAQTEALCDRYGIIDVPRSFHAVGAELIEAEFDIDQDKVIKQVWRQPLDANRDIVLVLTNEGFVKTVWVNLHSDKHRSLDKSRYVRR